MWAEPWPASAAVSFVITTVSESCPLSTCPADQVRGRRPSPGADSGPLRHLRAEPNQPAVRIRSSTPCRPLVTCLSTQPRMHRDPFRSRLALGVLLPSMQQCATCVVTLLVGMLLLLPAGLPSLSRTSPTAARAASSPSASVRCSGILDDTSDSMPLKVARFLRR